MHTSNLVPPLSVVRLDKKPGVAGGGRGDASKLHEKTPRHRRYEVKHNGLRHVN